MRTLLLFVLALALPIASLSPVALAQYVSDDASDAVYGDGWQTGDDGGTQLGAWTLNPATNSGTNGTFIGGGGGTAQNGCDLGAPCWALYANSGATADAVRDLDSALPVGGTITVGMDNGFINNGGSVGVSFRNSSGQNLLEVLFTGGNSGYTLSDGTNANTDTGLGFSASGLQITVEPTSTETYDIQIDLLGGATYSASGRNFTEGGIQRISQIRFFNFNAGAGSTNDAYFNDILAYQDRVTLGSGGDDGPGWRLMGAPGSGLTVGELADINLVQGVVGQYPDAGSNVITGYTNSGSPTFIFADNVTNSLDEGTGFIWYLYDNDLDPDDGIFGGGTSQSVALPQTISGDAITTRVTGSQVAAVSATNNDDAYLRANPYAAAFDLNDLSVTAGVLQNTVQVWDGTAYVDLDASSADTYIAPWQGFFAEVTGVSGPFSFTFDVAGAAVREASNGFIGVSSAERIALDFELRSAEGHVLDKLARVTFQEGASIGWDQGDASELAPFLSEYAMLAVVGAAPDGETSRSKAVESLPLDLDSVLRLPLQLESTLSETLTLSWAVSESMPSSWSFTLMDAVTGAEIDLRNRTEYTLEVQRGTQERFVLEIDPTNVVASEDGTTAQEVALAEAYPNPFADVTRIEYTMPQNGDMRLAVYDVLGREVALLADGPMVAGSHAATFDAARLPSGLYIVRLEVGNRALTRSVMHAR